MGEKKLWDVYHRYDMDGGFGDAVEQNEKVATVFATQEEIDDFLKKWDKPRVYAYPYSFLEEHKVYAVRVEVPSLDDVVPYEDYGEVFFKAIIKTPDEEKTKWLNGCLDRSYPNSQSSIQYAIREIERWFKAKCHSLSINGHKLNEYDYERDFTDFGVKDQDTVYIDFNM